MDETQGEGQRAVTVGDIAERMDQQVPRSNGLKWDRLADIVFRVLNEDERFFFVHAPTNPLDGQTWFQAQQKTAKEYAQKESFYKMLKLKFIWSYDRKLAEWSCKMLSSRGVISEEFCYIPDNQGAPGSPYRRVLQVELGWKFFSDRY